MRLIPVIYKYNNYNNILNSEKEITMLLPAVVEPPPPGWQEMYRNNKASFITRRDVDQQKSSVLDGMKKVSLAMKAVNSLKRGQLTARYELTIYKSC
jgi:hypothetical protein